MIGGLWMEVQRNSELGAAWPSHGVPQGIWLFSTNFSPILIKKGSFFIFRTPRTFVSMYTWAEMQEMRRQNQTNFWPPFFCCCFCRSSVYSVPQFSINFSPILINKGSFFIFRTHWTIVLMRAWAEMHKKRR